MNSSRERLVAGVLRVVRRGHAGKASSTWTTSSRTNPWSGTNYAAFLRARSKDRRGLYKGTSQGCTNPNVSMTAVVNGIVWGATSQPLRLVEAVLADGQRGGLRGVDGEDGLEELNDASSNELGLVDPSQLARFMNGLRNLWRFLALSAFVVVLVYCYVSQVEKNYTKQL